MSASKQSSPKPSGAVPTSPTAGKKSRVQKPDALRAVRKHADGDTEGDHTPTTANVVSQQVLEDVIDSGAALLYQRRMDRMCFSFAAYCTWKVLLSNVRMCCIEFDPGDSDTDASLWACGEIPDPAPLDTWAPGSLALRTLPASIIPTQIPKRNAKSSIKTMEKADDHHPTRRFLLPPCWLPHVSVCSKASVPAQR
ncbi:hypothetical protein BESB_036460 [Besnoitia besnoiti]|uniref:Uncharacterized protein n=1 Tax=Besnoitia besnoiti TaxID=94643 RepID=A0A2A9MFA4_BESBE|nr:hypothetical protein BESB_036460 [Besnoitia besnoiti]PFH37188.1 hypothetical protein BESB_036460 [Besnoitia besnoiti]